MDTIDSTSDHSPLLLQYGSARAAVVDGTPRVPITNAPPQWLHGTLRLPQFTLHEPVYLADDRNFSDEDVPAEPLPLNWREPPEFTTGESLPIHPSVQHARAGLGLDFTPVANTKVQHTPPDVTSTAKLPKKLRHEDREEDSSEIWEDQDYVQLEAPPVLPNMDFQDMEVEVEEIPGDGEIPEELDVQDMWVRTLE